MSRTIPNPPNPFNEVLAKPLTNHSIAIHIEDSELWVSENVSRYLIGLFNAVITTDGYTQGKNDKTGLYTAIVTSYVPDEKWYTHNLERVFNRVAVLAAIANKPGYLIVIDNLYAYFVRANEG